MLTLYSLALLLVLAVASPWWIFRMATSGKYREGLAERLGFIPARLRRGPLGHAAKPRVVWVHAVSVGEVLAAGRLIDELSQALAKDHPESWAVVISTTTRTGQRLARERFGADRVFYFPLDFAFAVRAWLRFLKPRLLVLVETEFWPRMLAECRRAEVPVAVANARISDRSWPRYRRLRRLWKPLLHSLAVVLAQSDLDAGRLRALGAARVTTAGNLKYDIRAVKPAPITEALRAFLPPGSPVLVCGSTLAGEEELLLHAAPANAVLILAPRHPERFEEVAQLLRRTSRPSLRRSAWAQQPPALEPAALEPDSMEPGPIEPGPLEPGTVFLLDSIGELASVYSLASAAFVGGSLIPAGGHNPLEPAQFAVPVLMGPHYENFRGIVERLRAQHALRIVTRAELASALAEALAGSPEAQAMGRRARAVFESEAGATARTVQALLPLLETQP